MRTLYEELAAYTKKGMYPFHMPGHKGNPDFLPPEPLLSLDVTELDNTDNLHNPGGCIAETQRRIGSFYGADYSFLLVNGSTAGIVSAIGAVCRDGDTIAVARNCHKSVFSGMALSGAKPVYFWPGDEIPEAKAVLVVSPTFEGDVLDIRTIAEKVHSRGGILIVDEAHGAHFPFHPAFPKGALSQGADIVIHSFHKTLPVFSQSAVVHVKDGRVDISLLRQFLSMVQSSSPSYLMMAATDYMLSTLQGDSSYFERYVENLLALRKALGEGLHTIPGGDIGKLVLNIPNANDWANRHKLALEIVNDKYALAMTSVADTAEGFARLEKAMKDAEIIEVDTLKATCPLPEVALSPKETKGKKTRKARLSESIGEIAGSFIMPFPPGIPLLAPGEKVTESVVSAFDQDCEIEVLLL